MPRRRGAVPTLVVVGAFSSGLALMFLVFGATVYPVPSGDSHAFLPPALLLEADQGLRNPLTSLKHQTNPTGGDRFLLYPPGFPSTLSLLMTRATPRAAFVAIGAINGINILLSAALLIRLLRRRWRSGEEPVAAILLAGLCLLAISTALAGHQAAGRPETLATFWLLLAIHLVLSSPPGEPWFAGLLTGFMGATHPAGSVILGLALTVHFTARFPAGHALAVTAQAALAAFGTFFALVAAGPFGMPATLKGLAAHASLAVVGRSSSARLVDYWVLHPGASFFAIPFLLALTCGLAVTYRKAAGRRATDLSLLFGSILLLGTAGWYFGLRNPEQSYNVLLFAPAVFAASFHFALGTTGESFGTRWIRPATATALAFASIGFLRSLVLFALFLSDGVSLEMARNRFEEVPTHWGRIAVNPSLWLLSEHYERMELFPMASHAAGLESDTLFVQQSYSGLRMPPDIFGFRLIEDRFVHEPCRILGIRVANTLPGYGYAIYRRAEASSASGNRKN